MVGVETHEWIVASSSHTMKLFRLILVHDLYSGEYSQKRVPLEFTIDL